MSIDTLSIERVAIADAPDEILRPLAALDRAIDEEAVPEDPHPPVETIVERWRIPEPDVERTDWQAMDGGRLVGAATLWRFRTPENQHLREAQVMVARDDRRRGVGTALLRELVTGLGDGLTLESWVRDRVAAAAAFAQRYGATPGLRMKQNQLDLRALDRALIRAWSTLDPAGYRLVWIDERVPEDLMPNVIVAYDTMNTAPREDLDQEDWRTTPELIRGWDETRERSGRVRRLALAIHAASGETAGYTETRWDPAYPHLVFQQGTAVVPEHRGAGLGKWLKARMLERLVAERPGVRYVRTGNANSNEPMLGINTKLGFHVVWTATVWQGKVADVRRALG